MPKKKSNRTIEARYHPDEDPERLRAKILLSPSTMAAFTLPDWLRVKAKPDLSALSAELHQRAEAVSSGNMAGAEEMLTAQAYVLDQIFGNPASRAIHTEYVSQMEDYLKLAFRAQRQCALTWEAVSAIQHPPTTTFAKQANVAHNQQINNCSRAQENEKPPTQLLEKADGNRLDFGATGAAGGADPRMATVGEINGTEDTRG